MEIGRNNMTYLFVITAVICICNLISVMGLILGSDVYMPYYEWIDPRSWFFSYPSMAFQV